MSDDPLTSEDPAVLLACARVAVDVAASRVLASECVLADALDRAIADRDHLERATELLEQAIRLFSGADPNRLTCL